MEANLVTRQAMKQALETQVKINASDLGMHTAKLAMYWLMDCQGQETPKYVGLAYQAKERAKARAKLIAACEILDADI